MLQVSDLQTEFKTKNGIIKAIDGVSFSLKQGEILGLVGESGSGKSVTGFSLMGLLDSNGKVTGGNIKFQGEELTNYSENQWRGVRGKDIAMIFQDPMMTLNPVLTIEKQMVEAILTHEKIPYQQALERCIETLTRVGIASANERIKAYPHQFSGGMRQRVAIAIALLNKPKLIIADEPTTALDVTIQGQILVEMQKIVKENNTSLIWITHDLGLVSNLADKIAVMYAGRVVESGTAAEVLNNPRHPYSYGLLQSLPARNKKGERLFQIEGSAPNLNNLPKGCAFAPRCFNKIEVCENNSPALINGVACYAQT